MYVIYVISEDSAYPAYLRGQDFSGRIGYVRVDIESESSHIYDNV